VIPADPTAAVRPPAPPPPWGPLLSALTAHAAEAAAHDGPAVVLADRPDATVVRAGGVVAKAHAADTDPGALATRLAVAAHPRTRGILLPPYEPAGPARFAEGRAVSVWPYGRTVDPGDPGAAPWEAAAVLLARLHAVPPAELPGPLPPMRGPAKAARAMARLRGVPDCAAARTVRLAWRRLPAWARDEAPSTGRTALCHGDWHLGQLVRHPGPDGDWLLIDVDDLGTGEPAWDLARPAMWFAAGLLTSEVWARFLGAYREAGGAAVPAEGDPWAHLDVPARTLAVQSAATAVTRAAREERDLDGAESELLATCARIAQLK
jgi:aminoglycoside phosphotransferase (APT) family kinase protein